MTSRDRQSDDMDLGGQVRRGMAWSLANNAVARAGSLVAGIVIARLLSPEDFGVYAVAMIALAALLSVNELGVSLAIVRWPGDVRAITPTVTTISVAGSALLMAASYVAAPFVAEVFGAPEATGVLRLLAAGVLIDGATAVPAALLTREFRQRARAGIDLTSMVVASAVTIVMAASGFGAWSLAWGRLAGNVVSACLLYVVVDRVPRPGFDRAIARELLAFGLPLAGSSLLVFAMLNIDYAVVGYLLGPVLLGLYVLAFNLSSWPVAMFSEAVRRVSMAGFSRIQHDGARLEESFSRSLGLLVAAALPVCVLLAVAAEPLVRVVYGEKWAASASPLVFLAALGMARIVAELAYDLLVSRGSSRSTLFVQVVWTAALAIALVVGTRADGLRGAALAHALVAWGLVVPLYWVALSRQGLRVGPSLRHLRRPLVGGVLLLAVSAACVRLLPTDLARVLGAGVLGLAAYAGVVWPMRRLIRAAPEAGDQPLPPSGHVSEHRLP